MFEVQTNFYLRRRQTACLLIILLFAYLITGCSKKDNNLPFTTIELNASTSGTGKYYESIEPGLILILQTDDVINLDGMVTRDSERKLQKLDFKKDFALLVFQGLEPNLGYGVQITSIKRQANIVNIYAQFREPGSIAQPAISSPYHLVKIKKVGNWGREITFQVVVDGKAVDTSSHFIP